MTESGRVLPYAEAYMLALSPQPSALGVLPSRRVIDTIARTIRDEIILEALSDQVIVVRRLAMSTVRNI